jgi:succinate dehydrogenase hydrophobic anchor subunit
MLLLTVYKFFPLLVLYALHYHFLLGMWQFITAVGCPVGTEWFGGASYAYVIPDDCTKYRVWLNYIFVLYMSTYFSPFVHEVRT